MSCPCIEVRLAERKRLLDAQATTPENDDQRTQTPAMTVITGLAHHGDDLLDSRRVGWVPYSLVARYAASVITGHCRWRATPTGGIKSKRNYHGNLLRREWAVLACSTRPEPQPNPQPAIMSRRYRGVMTHPVQSTIPGPETPSLSEEERAERRRRLMERVFSPDGLDRDTLKHIEQLAGEES
jgi:hypothetical protein